MKKIVLISVSFVLAVGLITVVVASFLSSGEESKKTVSTTASTQTKPTTAPTETTTETTKATEKATKAKKKETKATEAETETEAQSVDLTKSFNAICQYPQLPNGCEITSLTMVLNYLGYDVDKCDLSDNFLDKGEVGKVDFRKKFEGDPRDKDAYGCYAPVIVNSANKFLNTVGSEYQASEITDTEFENLFNYTQNGVPVMIWCTFELAKGHYSVTWNVDGKDMTWYTPEHCMVLLGEEGDKAVVADPASGEVKRYDKSLLKTRYEELFKQAVIIK